MSKGSGYFPQLQSSEEATASNSPVVEDSGGEDWVTICDEDRKEQNVSVKKSNRSYHRSRNRAQTYESIDRLLSRSPVHSPIEKKKLNTKRSLFQKGKDLVKSLGQLSTTDRDSLDDIITSQSALSHSNHRGASSRVQISKRARNVDVDTGSDNHDQDQTNHCTDFPAQVDSVVQGFKSNRYSQLPVLNSEHSNSQRQLEPKNFWAKSRGGITSLRNLLKGRKSSSGLEETTQKKKTEPLKRKAKNLQEIKARKQARIAERVRQREEFRIREEHKLRELSRTQVGLNLNQSQPGQQPDYPRYLPTSRSTEVRVVPQQRFSAQFGRPVLSSRETPRHSRVNEQSGRPVFKIPPGQRLSAQFARAAPYSLGIPQGRRVSFQLHREVRPSREVPGQRLNSQVGRAARPSREVLQQRKRLSSQFRRQACPDRQIIDRLCRDETRQHREAGRFRGPRGELIQYDSEHPLPGNSEIPAIQDSRTKRPDGYFGLSFEQQAEIEREGSGSPLEATEAQIAEDRERTYRILVGEADFSDRFSDDFSGQTLESFFGRF